MTVTSRKGDDAMDPTAFPALPTLTLHQPYASLIAERIKTVETRTWPAPKKLIGETIGIHAAAKRPDDYGEVGGWCWGSPGFGDDGELWLAPIEGREGYTDTPIPEVIGCDMPLGVIVATARLTACLPTRDDLDPGGREYGTCAATYNGYVEDEAGNIDFSKTVTVLAIGDDWDGWTEATDQLPYSDFRPGRWAWLFDDIAPTTRRCPACMNGEIIHPCNCPVCGGYAGCDPVTAKGRQRVWYWTPDERTDR